MKIKNLFLVAFVIFLFSLPIFADEKKEENPIDYWLYFQSKSEWSKDVREFTIDKSRAFAIGNLVEGVSFLVEFQIAPTVQLRKAQVEYQFGSQKIILGQQSNTFKFYNPPPHKRITINYPFKVNLVPTYDDLGITWQGRVWKVDYCFSALNGKGANYRDDNKDKDTVVWMKFSPLEQISLTGCWQGGYQEWTMEIEHRHYRSGYWFQGEIRPIKSLLIKPTYVKRNDLEKDGWFILALLDVNSKYRLIAQYLKDANDEEELTLGTNIRVNGKMRIMFNGIYRKILNGKTDLGLYIMTQINIGKDL